MADRYGDAWGGRLVTEAVRGEGGRLFNADGERFMERYSPDQMELDARDVVARAIAREVREGRGTENDGVYLDISHRDPAYVRERLPKMSERFADLGIDITEEPMEVAPTAHYSMGGVDIDWTTGATRVDRLYAVGETTAGVHGANRLGGNSLAETVAMGRVVGEHLADREPGEPDLPAGMRAYAERAMDSLAALATSDGTVAPAELVTELRAVMDDHAGIIRAAEGLEAGLDRLAEVRERTADLAVEGGLTGEGFELAVDLSFMLTVAEGVLRGALAREESRGAHHRSDHPEPDESWHRNLLYRRTDAGMELWTRGVPEPSPEIQAALEKGYELDYHHLE
jgi:succinate dehydrogenase / fumarate reductase flavoprotein subunit